MEVVYNFLNWLDAEDKRLKSKSLYRVKYFKKSAKFYIATMKRSNVNTTVLEQFINHLEHQFEKFDPYQITSATINKFLKSYQNDNIDRKHFIKKDGMNINSETGIIFDDEGIAIGTFKEGEKLGLSLKDVMVCEKQKWKWSFDALEEEDLEFISTTPYAV